MLFLLAVICLSPGRGAAVDVTQCGQVVPAGATGDLTTDLACAKNIKVENGATLRLNGHTITGSIAGTGGVCFLDECAAVWCSGRRCRVEGPGTLTGFSSGIGGLPEADPVDGKTTVHASNLTLEFNEGGISAARAVLENVVASDNLSVGISVRRLRLRNVEASRNGIRGIDAESVRGTDVTVEANGYPPAVDRDGVRATRCRFEHLVATGNGGPGVRATKCRLKGSTLLNNLDADVSTGRRPHLRDTTCDTSSDQAGGNWDVCTLD